MQLNIHKKNAKPMAAEKSSTVSAFSALSSMIDRFRIVFVLCAYKFMMLFAYLSALMCFIFWIKHFII